MFNHLVDMFYNRQISNRYMLSFIDPESVTPLVQGINLVPGRTQFSEIIEIIFNNVSDLQQFQMDNNIRIPQFRNFLGVRANDLPNDFLNVNFLENIAQLTRPILTLIRENISPGIGTIGFFIENFFNQRFSGLEYSLTGYLRGNVNNNWSFGVHFEQLQNILRYLPFNDLSLPLNFDLTRLQDSLTISYFILLD